MGEIQEVQVDIARKKHKKRKNKEPSVSREKDNEEGRRKRTKDEVLGDVGLSEAVGADNWSKKEKRKDRSSGNGEEEKTDGKEIRKHSRDGGDGKGVAEVLGSSEAEVLGNTCVKVEAIDARSKKKKKKDKNIVIAEDQEKDKKSKHSNGRKVNKGIPHVLEPSEAEGLSDISMPDVGFINAVSKKEKKKKGKSMMIAKDQKTPEKKSKRKRKDKGGAGEEEIIEESIKERKKKKKADSGAAPTSEQIKSRDKSTKKRKEMFVASDAIASLAKGKNKAFESLGKSNLEKQPKKVQFADNVEVFNLSENLSDGEEQLKNKKKSSDGLKRGIRFSKEEDEIVRKAVMQYVEDHQLGDEGLQMVMKCKEHKELKNCWKEIGEALPDRPYISVYYRAHILFERSNSRKWTKEELDFVKELHAKNGSDWKGMAAELGKHRVHVKDAYRRIKLANMKKGNWSQEEYQTLFDLVNKDLQMKAFMDKKLKHGMLRDNISWKEISDKLSTRTDPICCMKWYDQLTSPLVKEQKWADTDDYRLVTALVELDASCEEDVDWDSLLEHRSGDVCRKRWREMVHHLGELRLKPFSDQIDVLSKRYSPDLLEVREAYASKPAID